MSDKNQKPEEAKNQTKAKKHQVFVSGELKFETDKKGDALTEAYKHQEERATPIEIVHHDTQKVTLMEIGRYEKNYRVKSGDYAKFAEKQPVKEAVTSEVK